MDRNKLLKLLSEREEQFEKAKSRRNMKTIFGFSVAFFLVLCYWQKPTGSDYIAFAVVSFFLACVHFFVNAVVFSWLCHESEIENRILDDIRKQLSE